MAPVIFISLLISSISFGYTSVPYFPTKEEQCSEVNLKENPPSPELKLFFYSSNTQGALNWCYAYSAADLLSWELGVPVSATHLAIKTNNNLNVLSKFFRRVGKALFGFHKIVPEFGWQASTLKLALRDGACPDEIMPADNPDIEKINEEIVSINKISFESSENQVTCHEHRRLFPTNNIQAIVDVITEMRYRTVQDKLNALADKACRDKLLKPRDDRWLVTLNAADIDVIDVVNKRLSSPKKGPISLVISAQTLQDTGEKVGAFMAHSVTIMGRKFDRKSNTCRYLIRDSNGEEACWAYAKDKDCEDGYYWLTDEVVHKGAWNITYFDKNE